MTIRDIHEIIEFQLFRYRIAFFATGVLNFFIPAFFEVANRGSAVSFTAWQWVRGFEVLYFGTPIYSQSASPSMALALVLGISSATLSFRPRRNWVALASAGGCLASLLVAWNVLKISELAHKSWQGVAEVGAGVGVWWILLCYIGGTLLSLYPLVVPGAATVCLEENSNTGK